MSGMQHVLYNIFPITASDRLWLAYEMHRFHYASHVNDSCLRTQDAVKTPQVSEII